MKNLSKTPLGKYLALTGSYLASPMTIGLIVTFALTWSAIRLYSAQHNLEKMSTNSVTGILDQIHRKSIDFRLIGRGEFSGSPRVAILAIDQASIDREGRWPWPREKIGKLIERAVDSGAKVVGFDVVFSEADQNSSVRTLGKMKLNLSKSKQLTPEAEALFAKEIEAANSDKKMASTVGLYQDAVVMGTYFEEEAYDFGGKVSPLRDFCIDALYARSFEKKYWDKEQIFTIVEDPNLKESKPPDELLARVGSHLTYLEIENAKLWFEKNSAAADAIIQNISDLELNLPKELVAGLFVFANIGDEQNLFDVLSSNEEWKRFANRPMILQIFSVVLRSLTNSQYADLVQTINHTTNTYCARFLTPEDELLDREKYFKGSTQSKEAQTEIWQEVGLEPVWNASKKTETLQQAVARWSANYLGNPIVNFDRTYVSIPEIAASTKHTGYFNATLDRDGTIRRTRLVARRGNVYIPSLALKTFLVDRGYGMRFRLEPEDVGKSELKKKVVKSLEIIDKEGEVKLKVPVDEEGRMIINYSGPQQMFDYVRAASVMSNDKMLEISRWVRDPVTGEGRFSLTQVPREEYLKDKALIVGATAIGIFDLRLVPFEENYPGVETHANVLSNLLTEDARARGEAVPKTQPGFLKIHPGEERAMWLILLVGGCLLSGVLTYLGSIAGLAATIATLFGIYLVDRYVFFANGYLVNVSLPIMSALSIFFSITFYKYFTEERKKQELKGTFAKYVSPAVVDEILKDPGNIELGGKKMELTVMFSDVRGFTTISEKLDPRALSDLLNSYLTPMTDLVFQTKGTLDKYMGDAIMAFWGAPISFEDHADKAAECALKMLKKLKELQAEYAAKGLPTIDIGIGLNTGDMSVGNMGSNTVRSYTVMGDSVNLGSRLEGINKEYGTRIIVSEFTQSRISSKYVTREVDWVRVKGKAQPVRIFELIGTKAPGPLAAPENMLKVIEPFNEGFKLYHEKNFTAAIPLFTTAMNQKPDDECAQLYVERCQEYIDTPPPADWDGVYTMKTK